MATSLPNEVLLEIFKCEDDDINFLFSSLLVNRNWCQVVVVILWEKPFHLLDKYSSVKRDNNNLYKLINTYMSYNENSFFNYFKYLRHLYCANFFEAVRKWWAVQQSCKEKKNPDLVDYKSCLELLITQFVNHNAKLKGLDLRIVNTHDNKFVELQEIVLSNDKLSHWISQIRELNLGSDLVDYVKFFNMFDYCFNVNKIECTLSRENDRNYRSYRKKIVQFLSSQIKLVHLCLYFSDITNDVIEVVTKHENSLRCLEFDDVDFKDHLILTSFAKLDTLSVYTSTNLEKCLIPLDKKPLESLNTLIWYSTKISIDTLSSFIGVNKNLEVIDYKECNYCRQDGFELILKNIAKFCLNLKELATTVDSINQKEINLLNCLFNRCSKLKFLELIGYDEKQIDIKNILPLLVISPTSELKINGKKVNCLNKVQK